MPSSPHPRRCARRPARRPLAGLATAALLLAACGDGDVPAGEGQLQVVRDSVGDTLVVRTVRGSAWGGEARLVEEVRIGELDGPPERIFGNLLAVAVGPDGTMFALDGQVPAVRVFAPDGSYVQTLGRRGEGPGELAGPDWGMVMLSDGRVAVRDPRNARLQLYNPTSGEQTSWPVIPPGMSTSRGMVRARGDTLLTPVLMVQERDPSNWTMGLQRIGPEGTIIDTLSEPSTTWDIPQIEAHTENSSSVSHVPFAATHQSAYHQDGYWVTGISNRYAFTLRRPGNWLRVEREVEPVPVAPGEKAQAEALSTRNMRRTDPSWRWNGPAIPDTKPYFASLLIADDGRIVAVVEGPGVEGDDPEHDPTNPESIERRWRASRALDFFETDGTYLGRVPLPDLPSFTPRVIRDDHLWAVVGDELGVQRLVRYRIEPGTGAGAASG